MPRLWNSPTFTTSGSIATRLLGLSVLLPIALHKLSVEEANLWFLFSAVVGLLSLVDFGFSNTFTRFVAYSRRDSSPTEDVFVDNQRLRDAVESPGQIIGAMRWVYLRLGVASLVIMAILGTAAVAGPIAQIADGTAPWVSWCIVALSSSFVIFSGMYSAYLTGKEMIPEFRRWEILVGAVSTLVAILALLLGGGLLELVIVTQAGLVASALINRGLAIASSEKEHWTSRNPVDKGVLHVVWPVTWRSGVGIIMSAGIIQGTGIAYAQIAPAHESAPYLFALRLIQTARIFANVPFYTRLPTLAKEYASGATDRVIAIARTGMARTSWTFVAFIIAVGFLAPTVLDLIDSNTQFVSLAVWMLLGLSVFIERVGAMHLQLSSVTNEIVWHIANGVAGLVMLIVIPIAYLQYGLIGFPLGIMAGYLLVYAPYSMYKSYRAFDLSVLSIDVPANLLPGLIIVSVAAISML